jgi:hypothetical protein
MPSRKRDLLNFEVKASKTAIRSQKIEYVIRVQQVEKVASKLGIVDSCRLQT